MKQVWEKQNEISVGLERGSGEGNGTPLQYSSLENRMDGGAWWAAVHGVAKSQTRLRRLSVSKSGREGHTQLSDLTFTFSIQQFKYENSIKVNNWI